LLRIARLCRRSFKMHFSVTIAVPLLLLALPAFASTNTEMQIVNAHRERALMPVRRHHAALKAGKRGSIPIIARAAEIERRSTAAKCTKRTIKKVAHKSSSHKSSKPAKKFSKKGGKKLAKQSSKKPAKQTNRKITTAQASVSGGTTGTATFFNQDGTEGACGIGGVQPDSALLVALCPADFKAACGKPIHITNHLTGKSVVAKGNDECPGCACNHIDLSIGAYQALGSPASVGVIPISFTVG
jgi:hypothetical protein